MPQGVFGFDTDSAQIITCGSDDKCVGLDPLNQRMRSTSGRAVTKASAPEVALNDNHDALCIGGSATDCIKLGKKAKAAIAKILSHPMPDADAETNKMHFTLSADRTLATIIAGNGTGGVWNLKKDQAINVKSWSKDGDYSKEPASPRGFVGDLIVYTISPCAGPCGQSKLFNRSGKAVGKAFQGVFSLTKLSDDVAIGLGQEGGVVRISASKKSATVWTEYKDGAVEVGDTFVINKVPFMAMQTLAAADGDKLIVYKLTADGSAKESSFTVPLCPQ
jgi:hypothetical protein